MKGILCVSHGYYAEAFKESLKMIAGNVPNLHALCLDPTDGPEQFKNKLLDIQSTLDIYDKVWIFADLFGGSPCNTTFQHFFNNSNIEFIAGMNFPMVLTALLSDEIELEDCIEQGKESIVNVRSFMQTMMSDDEDE